MRTQSIRIATNSAGSDLGSVRTGVVHARISLLSRELSGLIVIGIAILAWLASGDHVEDSTRMKLVRGEPGAIARRVRIRSAWEVDRDRRQRREGGDPRRTRRPIPRR